MKSLTVILILTILTFNIAFSQVSQDWVQRFTSDSIKNDIVRDMFVDSEGNTYITGSQNQTGANVDIQALTVKYNSQGVLQWIQNYIAPANNGAFCRAIYVDAGGNVYVTGENAVYSGGANEMLVIKYSPTGTQLWSYRFQYVANFYCSGFGIITDADGNVYVTGEYGNGGNNIFLTKFSPGGALIGQTFYNNGSEGARKIAMDGAGKIIIGGYANTSSTTGLIALKYEQNLDLVWATRWDSLTTDISDMAVDINSNIILISTRTSTVDYATVKINSGGFVLWSQYYNSNYDIARGVVTDNSGNIYVTGESGVLGQPLTSRFCTVKYDPNGNQQWVSNYQDGDGYSAYDISIDNSANLYITGNRYSNSDIVTVKYNSGGDLQWNISYNGTANSLDAAVRVGTDQNGNVYTTGNSIGELTGYDIVLIKYIQTSIGIQNFPDLIPNSYTLSQNYPNPFNPVTNIEFGVPRSGLINLRIFDMNGKEVAALVNSNLSSGTYRYNFDASGLSSGVYFYKLEAEDFAETKRMLLLK